MIGGVEDLTRYVNAIHVGRLWLCIRCRSVLIVNVPSWHHYLEESSTHDTSVDIVDDVH